MQEGDFFIVVPRALVPLARRELELKWPAIISLAKERGIASDAAELNLSESDDGLGLKNLAFDLGLLLNLCLKIPTRILLRLAEFRCRDFPKLFKKTKKMSWDALLGECLPRIKVSAHKSRLMHHKRISATVEDALKGLRPALENESPDPATEQILYVRFDNDLCTLSLDTSGEPLYKRWGDKEVGLAPMRETLAAALFFHLWQRAKTLDPDALLIDPMAGSGTFLLEAENFSKSQYRRSYAFLHSTSLSKNSEAILSCAGQRLLTDSWRGPALGLEKDAKTYLNLGNNLEDHSKAHAKNLDFFKTCCEPLLAEFGPCKRFVLLNPPYGIRLKTVEKPQVFFKKLLARIGAELRPDVFGIIIPQQFASHCVKHLSQYTCCERLPFENGGLRVEFLIFSLREIGQ